MSATTELDVLREKNRHLGIINRFAVEMLALDSEAIILWHVAREVVAQLGFVDVVIYLLDEQAGVLRQHAAFGNKNPREYEILDPIVIELGAGVVGRVAASGESLLLDDTRNFPAYIEDDAVRLSELAVPIKDGRRVLGVIDSEHPDPGFYTRDHLETLNTVASITATKLRQVRTVLQLEQTVELLEYGKRLQETLFRIAEVSITAETLDELFRQLHQCMGELTYARNFHVALDTEDGKGIQYHYAVDEKRTVDVSKVHPARSDRPQLVAYVMHSEEPLLLSREDIQQLENNGVIQPVETAPASLIAVPFGIDSGRRGVVMVVSYDGDRAYQEKDRDLLQFVSKHVHNAIERTRARQNLTYLALHDSLTGLPNRSLFMDRLQHALDRRSRATTGILAVLFLDLDRFKGINDRYGHQTGDKFLAAVADRIAGCLRHSDTLCRLGGDEFAILIESAESREEIVGIAQRIVEAVMDPVWVGGIRIAATTSVGVTCEDGRGATAQVLLREADEAMYQAKSRGRNGYRLFEHKGPGPATSTLRIERDIADAIAGGQFFMLFQPICKLVGRRIIGAESLIRWTHPEQGLIGPAHFIPGAESNGLITDIDLAAVRLVLSWLREMEAALPPRFRVGINLSGQSLVSRDVVAVIRDLIRDAPDSAGHLYFEVTERALVENLKDAGKTIEQFRDMNIRVALDDFGTGYSSLSYLNRLPLDALKIDRTFVGSMGQDDSNLAIIEAIIAMARALNITTIAEGVENRAQADQLVATGCDLGQGYFFNRPATGNVLREMLRSDGA